MDDECAKELSKYAGKLNGLIHQGPISDESLRAEADHRVTSLTNRLPTGSEAARMALDVKKELQIWLSGQFPPADPSTTDNHRNNLKQMAQSLYIAAVAGR